MRLCSRLIGCVLVLGLALGCAGPRGSGDGTSPGHEFSFDGPGQLAVIFERHTDSAPERTLVVYTEAGRQVVPTVQPEEVRWLSTQELLVTVPETRSGRARGSSARLPASELRLIDLEGQVIARIGTARALYSPEPSPDGAFLALRVDVNTRGESDLEIWSLRANTGRIAQLRRALDGPRWSPDGARLVVAEPRQDAESDSHAVGFAGVRLPFPRLVLLRPSLSGPMVSLSDGPEPARNVAGGSFPLWWDREGIWARQRGSLVRCDAERGGCVPVYQLSEGAMIVGGRRTGERTALLLVRRDANSSGVLANELHRVDLVPGTGTMLWSAPPGLAIADLHWVVDQGD